MKRIFPIVLTASIFALPAMHALAQPPVIFPFPPPEDVYPDFYDPFFFNQPNPVDPDDLDYDKEPLNEDDPYDTIWDEQETYELDPYDYPRYGFPPYPFYVPLPPEPAEPQPAPQPNQPAGTP